MKLVSNHFDPRFILNYNIYTCRLENTLPNLQVTELMNTVEIEKQIAFDNNHLTTDLNAFERKWSGFKSKISRNEATNDYLVTSVAKHCVT